MVKSLTNLNARADGDGQRPIREMTLMSYNLKEKLQGQRYRNDVSLPTGQE